MSTPDETMEKLPDTPTRKPRRVGLLFVLLLVLGIGGYYGYHYWTIASTRITTDDAYLSADITQIAPQVSGTVTRIYVEENETVKAGQLLAELDDTTYRAAVQQAQANLDAVIAQAKGAGISVSLTTETGDAQLAQARGGVAQAQSGVASAGVDVERADAGITKAKAAAKAAVSNIGTAQAGLEAAQANKARAQSSVATAQAALLTAQANVKAAQAAVTTQQITADKAGKDAERYAGLLEKGAVSRQVADNYATAAKVAQSQLENVRQQVAMAQSSVTAREADVDAARKQVDAADAAISQAKAQIAAATDAAAAVQADVQQAEAARKGAQQSIAQAQAKQQQAEGQLQQAQTSPRQVELSDSNQAQAQAKIAQAKAALDAARIQLAHARIFAPVDGQVTKRSVEVGALVQPGTPLMALVQRDSLWVVANYKETQLTHITHGQRAEIRVDALGGRRFTGHVDSISAGTGATFALLPPDNATGNFTKVVQRVPVKIVLDPGQPEMDRLCTGLSVSAAVLIK